jgi:hypothetical protein
MRVGLLGPFPPGCLHTQVHILLRQERLSSYSTWTQLLAFLIPERHLPQRLSFMVWVFIDPAYVLYLGQINYTDKQGRTEASLQRYDDLLRKGHTQYTKEVIFVVEVVTLGMRSNIWESCLMRELIYRIYNSTTTIFKISKGFGHFSINKQMANKP